MLSKMKVSLEDRAAKCEATLRRPGERQRFTPWLEEQINGGGIDGLEWIDREKGLFKLLWMRMDDPEFVLETAQNDGLLFEFSRHL